MKIASWNCNNLNTTWNIKPGNRKNREDYLNLLRKNSQDLDVIFLMEVESDFPETALDKDFSFHFFYPCTDWDNGWIPMTSGIFLTAAQHMEVIKDEKDGYYNKVLLPGKGNESEYGFALRTLLRNSKNGETLDLVTFWNTRRKTKPSHDYELTLKLLLKNLADTDFFSQNNRHIIIGDFNMGYQDIKKLIPDTETVLVSEDTYFKKKNPDEKGSSLDHIICSKADLDSIRFLGKDGQLVRSFEKSLGFTERHAFVRKEPKKISDHLPLFVQI